MSSKHAWTLSLLLLAFALRLLGLDGQSLWHDEAFSAVVSGVDWPLFWTALLADGVHPPGYYLLLRAGQYLFGGSEFALRFISVIAGTLAVPLIYRLGRTLGGHRWGVGAGLLLALNPFAIWYAREARMYSLLLCLTIAGGYAFWRFVRQPGPSRWMWFTGLSALAFAIHYFAFILSIIQFLFLAVTLGRNHRALRGWVAAQAAAFLFFLPWAVALLARQGRNFGIGWISPPTLLDLPLTLSNLAFILADPAGWLTWAAAGLVIGLVALTPAIMVKNGHHAETAVFLLIWLLFPPIFIWLLSLRLPLYVDRQFIICLPPLLLLLGYLNLRSGAAARGAMAVLVCFSAIAAGRLWLDPGLTKEDWRAVAETIQQTERPDDVLVMHSMQSRIPFSYYYDGHLELKLATLNLETFPLDRLANGHRRLWLLYRRPFEATHALAGSQPYSWQDDQNPILQSWLAAHRQNLVREITMPGVYLLLYDLSSL